MVVGVGSTAESIIKVLQTGAEFVVATQFEYPGHISLVVLYFLAF